MNSNPENKQQNTSPKRTKKRSESSDFSSFCFQVFFFVFFCVWTILAGSIFPNPMEKPVGSTNFLGIRQADPDFFCTEIFQCLGGEFIPSAEVLKAAWGRETYPAGQTHETPSVQAANWRIPISKQAVTAIYEPWKGHLEGEPQPYLGDFRSPWLPTTYIQWEDAPSTEALCWFFQLPPGILFGFFPTSKNHWTFPIKKR